MENLKGLDEKKLMKTWQEENYREGMTRINEKIGVKELFVFRKLILKTVHMNYLFK